MKEYVVSGGAVKSDGTRYPFHKSVQASSRDKASDETIAWLKGKGERPNGSLKVRLKGESSAHTASVAKSESGKEKYCPYCERKHPVEAFGLDSKSPDARAGVCKEGRRKMQAEQRQARREGQDAESLLTKPRGEMAARVLTEGREQLRKINLDGESFIHLGDLIQILRRPR